MELGRVDGRHTGRCLPFPRVHPSLRGENVLRFKEEKVFKKESVVTLSHLKLENEMNIGKYMLDFVTPTFSLSFYSKKKTKKTGNTN